MKSFLRQAAIALVNARLFEETERYAQELEHIANISAALRMAPSYKKVQEVVVEKLITLFNAAGTALARCNIAQNEVIFETVYGRWPELTGLVIPYQGSVASVVLRTGEPFVIDNQLTHPVLAKWDFGGGVYALACIPLFVDDVAIGVFWIGRAQPFGEGEVRLMVAIADIVANALHRAQAVETLEQRVIERTWELAAANDRLTDLDRLKSKFVSDVSHELRTPLQNLKMYLELLARGRADRHDHYLAVLKEQTAHLQYLTEDILDLSRLELSVGRVTFEAIDLNYLVTRVVANFQLKLETSQLTLELLLHPHLIPIQGVGNQLTQVITNLLTNAINYTPTGKIVITTCCDDDKVILQIEDTGMGIAAVDVPHLFQRFYRGSHIGQSNIRGTGLGLAIVKEIVDLHGGQVLVKSEEGKGTIFCIYLPAQPTTYAIGAEENP